MKQIFKYLLLTLLAFTSIQVQAVVEPKQPAVGDGTRANPLRITTAAELLWFRDYVNHKLDITSINDISHSSTCAYLMNDIDLTGTYEGDWEPIGSYSFSGVFRSYKPEPNGHGEITTSFTIKGISIKHCTEDMCGFFRNLEKNAEVRNLNLEVDIDVDLNNVGGLTGYASDPNVSCITVRGKVKGNKFVGGVFGRYSDSTRPMSRIVNYADVQGSTEYVGGIAGTVHNAELCANYGDVTAPNAIAVGGIAGDAKEITDCLNQGRVEGKTSVGGIAGYSNAVSNCFVMNSVYATNTDINYGIVCGSGCSEDKLLNCYYYETAGYVANAPALKLYRNGEEVPIMASASSPLANEHLMKQHVITAGSGETCMRLMGMDRLYDGSENSHSYSKARWVQKLASTGSTSHDGYPRPLYYDTDANNVVLGLGEWYCDNTFSKTTKFTNQTTGPNGEHYYEQDQYFPAGVHRYDMDDLCEACGDPKEPTMDQEGYYQLRTVGGILWLRNAVAASDETPFKAKLMEDVSLSRVCGPEKGSWTPIGQPRTLIDFEGQGHTISNLYIQTDDETPCGFFGNVSSANGKSTIKNVKFDYINIDAPKAISVGVLAGRISWADISDVNVMYQASIVGGEEVGGIVGRATRVTLSKSTNYADLSATKRAGGLIGIAIDNATISDCVNYGSITSEYSTGGIVSDSYADIARCTNNGKVTTSGDLAGGISAAQLTGVVTDCANYGDVKAATHAGGIMGNASGGVREASYLLNVGCVEVTSEEGRIGALIGQTESPEVLTHSFFSTDATLTAGGNVFQTTTPLYWYEADASVKGVSSLCLRSGEVAYLLQNSSVRNAGGGKSVVWIQNMKTASDYPLVNTGGGEALEVFLHYYLNCLEESMTDKSYYDNNVSQVNRRHYDEEGYTQGHHYVDDVCQVCGRRLMTAPTQAPDGFYEIASASHLLWFADQVNHSQRFDICARLVADIDLSSVCSAQHGSWEPIGGIDGTSTGVVSKGYCGTFDGQGHTITGLYINLRATHQGLFGVAYNDNGAVRRAATLRHLVVDGYVATGGYSGILAGLTNGGVIEHVTTRGQLTVGGSTEKIYVAPICGAARQSTVIRDCYNYAKVTIPANAANPDNGYVNVGGIVGRLQGTMERCINYGTLDASGAAQVGGLVGYADGDITDCANAAAVTGRDYVGGLAGFYTNVISITRCFNAGELSVTKTLGKFDAIACQGSGSARAVLTGCLRLTGQPNGSTYTVYEHPASDFRYGRVAYGLHQLSPIWGQNIGGTDVADQFPAIGAPEVYYNDDFLQFNTLSRLTTGTHILYWTFATPSPVMVETHFLGGIDGRSGDRLDLTWSDDNLSYPNSNILLSVNGSSDFTSKEGETLLNATDGKLFFRVRYNNAYGGQEDTTLGDGGLSVYLSWFSNSPTSSLICTDGTPGDINGDGQITMFDVALLVNALSRHDVIDMLKGDVNMDGVIDVDDVKALEVKVMKFYLP